MKIRPRKSLGFLSDFFARSKKGIPSYLVWILFNNDAKQLQDDKPDCTSAEGLAKDVRAHSEVESVTLLRNTNPSQGTPVAIFPRTSPLSMLVYVNGAANLNAVVQDLNHLLQDVSSRIQASDKPSLSWTMNTYARTQDYRPGRSRNHTGTCIVSVAMEPAGGQDEDVESWYRQEHLDMQAANAFFVRSNRFEHMNTDETLSTVPKLLALHEYTSMQDLLDHSLRVGPIVKETEWSKRVLGSARSVERTSWTVQQLL